VLIPALVVGTIPVGLLARAAVWAAPELLPHWEWAQLLLGRIVAPFVVASFFAAYEYEMLFALTPHRGRGAAGWVFFVPLTLNAAVNGLALSVLRVACWIQFLRGTSSRVNGNQDPHHLDG
jgi:hypothetical protein